MKDEGAPTAGIPSSFIFYLCSLSVVARATRYQVPVTISVIGTVRSVAPVLVPLSVS